MVTELVGFGVEDITQLLEDIVRLEGVPTNDRKYKLYQFKMKGVRLNLERIVDALESYIEDNYSEQNP